MSDCYIVSGRNCKAFSAQMRFNNSLTSGVDGTSSISTSSSVSANDGHRHSHLLSALTVCSSFPYYFFYY